MSRTVLNIAHRGASGTRPENTLAAFRRAIEIGADFIELDVRATADGVAVVMHDATVDRTTNGSGRVAELTLRQIQALDAGSWFSLEFAGQRVPTLVEAVSLAAGKIALSMELKETGVEEQAVAALRQAADGQSFISSFHDECLARVRTLDPAMRIELIVGIDPLSEDEIARLIRRAQGLGASLLAPSYRGITPGLVAAAARAAIGIIAWTVDNREDMRRMMELGITGITTNYPEVLKDMLGRQGV
jgi:glycerophosphoryl diester phosphodiesterase